MPYLNYDNGVMSNLWLSPMGRMGVEDDHDGDGDDDDDSIGRLTVLRV